MKEEGAWAQVPAKAEQMGGDIMDLVLGLVDVSSIFQRLDGAVIAEQVGNESLRLCSWLASSLETCATNGSLAVICVVRAVCGGYRRCLPQVRIPRTGKRAKEI